MARLVALNWKNISLKLLYILRKILSLKYICSQKAVSLNDKEEILAAFKRVMYAPTPELNEIAANNFVNRLSEVLVRLGSRDQDKFQPATGYYFKHWEAYAPQWMFIHRRTIPGMETENTNNRLERLWRSMKGIYKYFVWYENLIWS